MDSGCKRESVLEQDNRELRMQMERLIVENERLMEENHELRIQAGRLQSQLSPLQQLFITMSMSPALKQTN